MRRIFIFINIITIMTIIKCISDVHFDKKSNVSYVMSFEKDLYVVWVKSYYGNESTQRVYHVSLLQM